MQCSCSATVSAEPGRTALYAATVCVTDTTHWGRWPGLQPPVHQHLVQQAASVSALRWQSSLYAWTPPEPLMHCCAVKWCTALPSAPSSDRSTACHLLLCLSIIDNPNCPPAALTNLQGCSTWQGCSSSVQHTLSTVTVSEHSKASSCMAMLPTPSLSDQGVSHPPSSRPSGWCLTVPVVSTCLGF